MLNPMVVYEHSLWCLAGFVRASQETVISGSCQQEFLSICISVRVWWLYIGYIPSWADTGWPFLQYLLHTLSLISILFSPSGKYWSIHTLVFPLEHHLVCDCILDILSYWANIHLSLSKYHLCTFVTGLPLSGWYFLVSSLCMWISWSHCF